MEQIIFIDYHHNQKQYLYSTFQQKRKVVCKLVYIANTHELLWAMPLLLKASSGILIYLEVPVSPAMFMEADVQESMHKTVT